MSAEKMSPLDSQCCFLSQGVQLGPGLTFLTLGFSTCNTGVLTTPATPGLVCGLMS